MGTAPPVGEEEVRRQLSDRLMLAEMLEEMRKALRNIVHDETTPFLQRDLFIDTWADVQKAFDSSVRKLRMSPVLFWLLLYPIRLRRAGLTGKMLSMKVAVWKQNLYAWGGPVAPYGNASKADAGLDQMNTILGSAAKVFPPLEIAKEYKEMTHVQLKLSQTTDFA